jgi:biotin carboxyl carrier protein
MRNYQITIGGKTYLVQIDDPHARPVHVEVDGRPFEVYVDWEGTDDEAAVTPEIRPVAPDAPSAEPAVTRPKPPARRQAWDTEDEASDTLTAPMPGTILSIAVKAGDSVQQGQEVCVLEAMKMKNSIKSPREGTIAEVAATVGASVAYGEVLVRFQ